MCAAVTPLNPIPLLVFPPSSAAFHHLSRVVFHLIQTTSQKVMAPFPSISGLEWPKSLARAIATRTTGNDLPSVVRRQQVATVTVIRESGGGGGSNLSGGAIAGIVIGSVVGVLLLIWIVRSCFNLGAPPQEREKWYRDAPPPHHHRSHSRHHHRSRSRGVEVPPAIYVQQSRSRSRSRRPSATYVVPEEKRGRSGGRRQSGSYYV